MAGYLMSAVAACGAVETGRWAHHSLPGRYALSHRGALLRARAADRTGGAQALLGHDKQVRAGLGPFRCVPV